MNKFSKTLRDNWIFLLMVLPGTIWLILFFYIPVFGNVVAFKDYHMTGEGFVHSIINSNFSHRYRCLHFCKIKKTSHLIQRRWSAVPLC